MANPECCWPDKRYGTHGRCMAGGFMRLGTSGNTWICSDHFQHGDDAEIPFKIRGSKCMACHFVNRGLLNNRLCDSCLPSYSPHRRALDEHGPTFQVVSKLFAQRLGLVPLFDEDVFQMFKGSTVDFIEDNKLREEPSLPHGFVIDFTGERGHTISITDKTRTTTYYNLDLDNGGNFEIVRS